MDKHIKKQNFIQAKEIINKLVDLQNHGEQEIKRDALIAVDHIRKRYGSTDVDNFLLPDWQGDFRGIKKKIKRATRTNNIIELKQVIQRLTIILSNNNDKKTRENAVETLIDIAETNKRNLEEFEQSYIKSLLRESDKKVQKLINVLLRLIDPSYPEDFEKNIEELSKQEKVVKVKTSYSFDTDFIRYKVKITNNTNEHIWDVRYLITKYEDNFVLREVIPNHIQRFEEYLVLLSVIQAGDTKEFIARVEPKSMQLFLEGKLYYKKYEDTDFNILAADDVVVDVVDAWGELDPSVEKASIVHCRELFDYHVKHKSMNTFALPVSISPELAFKIGKRILSDFGFSLVMEIMNEDSFFGEAVFYGAIKQSGSEEKKNQNEEIVIILRASHENYAIEINVGTDSNAHLVAIQVKFDTMLRQLLKMRKEWTEIDKLIELRCPNCFQAFDKIDREWCPWCGEDISKDELLN